MDTQTTTETQTMGTQAMHRDADVDIFLDMHRLKINRLGHVCKATGRSVLVLPLFFGRRSRARWILRLGTLGFATAATTSPRCSTTSAPASVTTVCFGAPGGRCVHAVISG